MANEPTSGNGRIEGDAKPNKLTGTPGPDEIDGWGDHDKARGRGDRDVIWGGDGNDTLRGNGGDDRIWGGQGHDKLYGGTGNDNLVGGLGNDTLYGGDGNDILYGSAGDDGLTGGAGSDRFEFVIGNFSNGNDTIRDFGAGDTIHFITYDEDSNVTSPRIDIEVSQVGGDTLIKYGSGKGKSTITLKGVKIEDLDQADFVGVGSITCRIDGTEDSDRYVPASDGTPEKDTALRGTEHRDIIDGKGGNDDLYGGGGNDALYGGGGNDILYGGDGDDTLYGNGGSDELHGGDGDDTLEGGAGRDVFRFDKDRDNGHDTIKDFLHLNRQGLSRDYILNERDLIQIKGDADFTFNKLTITDNADGHAVIKGFDDDSSITVEGVSASELTAADFTFIA